MNDHTRADIIIGAQLDAAPAAAAVQRFRISSADIGERTIRIHMVSCYAYPLQAFTGQAAADLKAVNDTVVKANLKVRVWHVHSEGRWTSEFSLLRFVRLRIFVL